MYNIINVEQGSPDWFAARLGKVTASILDRVVTPAGKVSSSRDVLVNRAVAELIMEVPDDTFQSDSMLRGKELEDEALEFFNFTNEYEFEKVGFLSQVNEKGVPTGFGLSPDGLWKSQKATLELKCPEPHTHLAYLGGNCVPKTYFQQTQAPFLLGGVERVFFGSYHPNFKCLCVEVMPDEAFLKLAKPIVKETCQMIAESYIQLSKFVRVS